MAQPVGAELEKPETGGESSPEFDACAADYEAQLQQGLALSGEGKGFFAEGRMRWLRGRLEGLGAQGSVKTVLDFGCGTGGSVPFFFDVLGVERVFGVDPSEASLEVARREWEAYEAAFGTEAPAGESVDLAFCNGVFHHIPPADRREALEQIVGALEPGGLFAFWENNPWNPVTRYAMSKVPFDADAILVWPHEARRMLGEAGFEVLRTDYCFFFPHFARGLRGLEPGLDWLPLGGQYLVLARKAR